MATISQSSLLNGIRGKVGDLVFRQFQGKTVVQLHTQPRSKKRSPLQQRSNHKMREAAIHVNAALRNPAVKAHYEKKKKRLNVTSAYTAACTDFLRHGRIDNVDTSKYNNGTITVKAFKPDLSFEHVLVKIMKKDRTLLNTAKGIPQPQAIWLFKFTKPLPPLEEVVISIEATDKIGNITRLTHEAGKKDSVCHDWGGAQSYINQP